MKLAVVVFTEDHFPGTLQELAERSQEGIRAWIRRHVGKTGRLERSIKCHVYGRRIVIESDVEYARALDQGTMTSKSMWHLINKVIPLKLKSGITIFRRVTAESIRDGKWRQKPRQGLDFVRKGLDLAKAMGSFDDDQIDFQVVKEP